MFFNRVRAETLLAEAGLNALIATSPENVYYMSSVWSLSHWVMKGTQVYSVFWPGADEIGLVAPVSDLDLVAAAGHPPGSYIGYGGFTYFLADEVGDEPHDLAMVRLLERPRYSDPQAGLVALLGSHSSGPCRLGVDESNLSPSQYLALQQALPHAQIEPAAALFQRIRAAKTEAELSRLRYAAEATERALERAVAALRPGVTEQDVAAVYRVALAEQGVDFAFACVGFANHTAYSTHKPTGRKLEQGDLIRFDIGGRFDGYFADTARMFSLGPASDKAKRYYEALVDGQQAALEMVRPGAVIADLVHASEAVVKQVIPHYRRHHIGHGIGLETYEQPALVPGNEAVLEEGMVLTVEPCYYELGFGGVQIEDTIVVTADGFRYLTAASRDLIEL